MCPTPKAPSRSAIRHGLGGNAPPTSRRNASQASTPPASGRCGYRRNKNCVRSAARQAVPGSARLRGQGRRSGRPEPSRCRRVPPGPKLRHLPPRCQSARPSRLCWQTSCRRVAARLKPTRLPTFQAAPPCRHNCAMGRHRPQPAHSGADLPTPSPCRNPTDRNRGPCLHKVRGEVRHRGLCRHLWGRGRGRQASLPVSARWGFRRTHASRRGFAILSIHTDSRPIWPAHRRCSH